MPPVMKRMNEIDLMEIAVSAEQYIALLGIADDAPTAAHLDTDADMETTEKFLKRLGLDKDDDCKRSKAHRKCRKSRRIS